MSEPRLTPEQFERACAILPEEVMWGEHLTVEIVLHIAQASRRAAIEECWEAVHRERLEDPTDSADDTAYQCAIEDAEHAIRALATGDKHE